MVDTRRAVIQAMENISPSQDPETRNHLLNVGLKEMIRWFTLAARVIVNKKIQLPKQTLTFMQKHHAALQQLANTNVDDTTKRQLILKPGGSGFLGGVMIRSLLRWDGKKTVRKFNKSPPKKRAVRQAPAKRRAVRRSPAKKRPTRKSPVKLRTTRNLGSTKKPKRKTAPKINDRFVTKRRQRRPVRPLSPTPSPPSFSQRLTSTPLSTRSSLSSRQLSFTPMSSASMTPHAISPVVSPWSSVNQSTQGSFSPTSHDSTRRKSSSSSSSYTSGSSTSGSSTSGSSTSGSSLSSLSSTGSSTSGSSTSGSSTSRTSTSRSRSSRSRSSRSRSSRSRSSRSRSSRSRSSLSTSLKQLGNWSGLGSSPSSLKTPSPIRQWGVDMTPQHQYSSSSSSSGSSGSSTLRFVPLNG